MIARSPIRSAAGSVLTAVVLSAMCQPVDAQNDQFVPERTRCRETTVTRCATGENPQGTAAAWSQPPVVVSSPGPRVPAPPAPVPASHPTPLPSASEDLVVPDTTQDVLPPDASISALRSYAKWSSKVLKGQPASALKRADSYLNIWENREKAMNVARDRWKESYDGDLAAAGKRFRLDDCSSKPDLCKSFQPSAETALLYREYDKASRHFFDSAAPDTWSQDERGLFLSGAFGVKATGASQRNEQEAGSSPAPSVDLRQRLELLREEAARNVNRKRSARTGAMPCSDGSMSIDGKCSAEATRSQPLEPVKIPECERLDEVIALSATRRNGWDEKANEKAQSLAAKESAETGWCNQQGDACIRSAKNQQERASCATSTGLCTSEAGRRFQSVLNSMQKQRDDEFRRIQEDECIAWLECEKAGKRSSMKAAEDLEHKFGVTVRPPALDYAMPNECRRIPHR